MALTLLIIGFGLYHLAIVLGIASCPKSFKRKDVVGEKIEFYLYQKELVGGNPPNQFYITSITYGMYLWLLVFPTI
jgi:hypothetical protein